MLAKGLAWVQTKQNYDNINGLSRLIHVAVGCNYAISSNVDTEDGLTNGAICIMRYIDYRNTPTHKVPSILWVEFTDSTEVIRHEKKENICISQIFHLHGHQYVHIKHEKVY